MDSKLQIISGRFHGRKLYLPPNARPTQNRARAALFNMLGARLVDPMEKLNVWDAFAGSGAFGIECLSRYPNVNVVFTDVDTESVKTIKKNLGMLNVGANGRVDMTDAIAAVAKYGAMADLVFVDAPYDTPELGAALVQKLTQVAHEKTILVWEQEAARARELPDGWRMVRNKQYGRARFLIAVRE